jgi:hypothetical protein
MSSRARRFDFSWTRPLRRDIFLLMETLMMKLNLASKPLLLVGMTSLFVAFSAGAADEARNGRIKHGWYPGVKQTNLVANKPEFGAQILEPDLKNPWGIAIRPAGFGGHWWLAANKAGKSIQYVGDVGDTPLFQDELKVVDTLGAPTGVVFNA